MGGTLGPQQRTSRPRLQQEAVGPSHPSTLTHSPPLPFFDPCWRDGPSEAASRRLEPEGLDRPSSGPPMGDGMGQGPSGPPQHLYLLKNTCRDWGAGWRGWPERGGGLGRPWCRLRWQYTG